MERECGLNFRKQKDQQSEKIRNYRSVNCGVNKTVLWPTQILFKDWKCNSKSRSSNDKAGLQIENYFLLSDWTNRETTSQH